MFYSLQPHGLQHARLPCPSPTPRACSDSYPSSWWCHPTILILCHPLLLLPSIFSKASGSFPIFPVLCITWPEYCSFSFSISPSNKYSGLIFFRIDWFELLTVQGTLKSLLQLLSVKLKKIPSILFYQRIIFNLKWMLKSFIHLFQICRDGIICGFSLLFHC